MITEYHADGKPTLVKQGSGDTVTTIAYTYNNAGQLTQMNHNGQITTYEYDQAGRLIKTTDPMGKSELNSYDAAGNDGKSFTCDR